MQKHLLLYEKYTKYNHFKCLFQLFIMPTFISNRQSLWTICVLFNFELNMNIILFEPAKHQFLYLNENVTFLIHHTLFFWVNEDISLWVFICWFKKRRFWYVLLLIETFSLSFMIKDYYRSFYDQQNNVTALLLC